MLNKSHINIFKQQAVFYTHICITEHKFKILYIGLGISKSISLFHSPGTHCLGSHGLPLSSHPHCLVQSTGHVATKELVQIMHALLTLGVHNLCWYKAAGYNYKHIHQFSKKNLYVFLCPHEHKSIYRSKTNGTWRLHSYSRTKAWIPITYFNKIQKSLL